MPALNTLLITATAEEDQIQIPKKEDTENIQVRKNPEDGLYMHILNSINTNDIYRQMGLTGWKVNATSHQIAKQCIAKLNELDPLVVKIFIDNKNFIIETLNAILQHAAKTGKSLEEISSEEILPVLYSDNYMKIFHARIQLINTLILTDLEWRALLDKQRQRKWYEIADTYSKDKKIRYYIGWTIGVLFMIAAFAGIAGFAISLAFPLGVPALIAAGIFLATILIPSLYVNYKIGVSSASTFTRFFTFEIFKNLFNYTWEEKQKYKDLNNGKKPPKSHLRNIAILAGFISSAFVGGVFAFLTVAGLTAACGAVLCCAMPIPALVIIGILAAAMGIVLFLIIAKEIAHLIKTQAWKSAFHYMKGLLDQKKYFTFTLICTLFLIVPVGVALTLCAGQPAIAKISSDLISWLSVAYATIVDSIFYVPGIKLIGLALVERFERCKAALQCWKKSKSQENNPNEDNASLLTTTSNHSETSQRQTPKQLICAWGNAAANGVPSAVGAMGLAPANSVLSIALCVVGAITGLINSAAAGLAANEVDTTPTVAPKINWKSCHSSLLKAYKPKMEHMPKDQDQAEVAAACLQAVH